MNDLVQQSSYLIGSLEDIKKLEKKKQARILVISDSHGDYDVFFDIIEEFGPDADAMVFCGDGVCDLVQYLEEAQDNEALRKAVPPVLAFVKGNGDSERYFYEEEISGGQVRRIIAAPHRIIFTAAGRHIMAVHGNRHGVDIGTETLLDTASSLDADIVLFGHTHRPYWEERAISLVLNPGSCSRPRGGMPASFAVITFPGLTDRYCADFFEIGEGLFGKKTFRPFRLGQG
jgi:uncharacterized protein